LEAKLRLKLDDPALTGEIMGLFKQDLSPDQISGRLRVLYPEQQEKQASPSTIYTYLYKETANDPSLKAYFRQNRISGRE
jgi:IS30 family transposase